MHTIRYLDGNEKQTTARDVTYPTRREAHTAALAAGYRLGQRIVCVVTRGRIQCATRPSK